MRFFSSSERPTKASTQSFVLPLLFVASTTAVLSILLLAFKADAAITYHKSTGNGLSTRVSFLIPDRQNGGLHLAMYPEWLRRSTADPALGGAGISMASAIGIGLLCIFVRHRTKPISVS